MITDQILMDVTSANKEDLIEGVEVGDAATSDEFTTQGIVLLSEE